MGEDDLGPVEVNLLALLDWSLENGNAQAARVLRHCFNKIEVEAMCFSGAKNAELR